MKPTPIELDATDRRLLSLLQADCALTNDELARLAHVSPATSLRRVRRLVQAGVIERRIAIVSAEAAGGGVTAIVEVTLEQQSAELLDRFERATAADACVRWGFAKMAGSLDQLEPLLRAGAD
jgi:Lrp/AsnC family leucine-responsive transcriptional regulator